MFRQRRYDTAGRIAKSTKMAANMATIAAASTPYETRISGPKAAPAKRVRTASSPLAAGGALSCSCCAGWSEQTFVPARGVEALLQATKDADPEAPLPVRVN